jgi:hypothetical protein
MAIIFASFEEYYRGCVPIFEHMKIIVASALLICGAFFNKPKRPSVYKREPAHCAMVGNVDYSNRK